MAVLNKRQTSIKPKYEKPTLKNRIATGVAMGLLAGSLNVGIREVNNPLKSHDQRSIVKSVIEQEDKNLEVPKINSRNPNLIRETVNSYNQKAKLGQIFFYDGKKIKSVYFDQTRLSQINSIIPRNEKAKINNLILERVKLIEENAIHNPTLGKKIINRVGELDYAKYLLSLTPRELRNAFPEAETAVRKALENSNPEILKKINKDKKGDLLFNVIFNTIIWGLYGGVFKAKGKKIEP